MAGRQWRGIFQQPAVGQSGRQTEDGTDIRFTRKADSAYAFVLEARTYWFARKPNCPCSSVSNSRPRPGRWCAA